jgi:cold-inducible RNA-binding protein
MAIKLFVAGLPYSLKEADLESAFAAVGTVASVKIITDRETGKSRGFGFVEMENDDEAKEAIKQLDGSDMQGRSIAVSEAKPREEKSRGTGSFRQNNRY